MTWEQIDTILNRVAKAMIVAGLLISAVGLAVLMTGCAPQVKAGPTPTPSIVQVPVAVSCVPKNLGDKPQVQSPQELAAIKEGPDRYIALAAAYLDLWARSLQAEPVIADCRKVPPTS